MTYTVVRHPTIEWVLARFRSDVPDVREIECRCMRCGVTTTTPLEPGVGPSQGPVISDSFALVHKACAS